MSDFKIEFISKGFREILEGAGVRDLVKSTADGIRSRAGAGFETELKLGKFGGGRWVGFVSSTDRASARAESENKVLSKAVK